MAEEPYRTDERVLREMGERLVRLRLDRDQTQAALAREAGVSKRTIERIESGHSTQSSSLIRVLRALGLMDNLDVLIPPATPSPIEQLERQGKTRRRASSKSHSEARPEPWRWDDDA